MDKTPTSKDSVRHALLLSQLSRDKLVNITKEFKINQAEVIETILEKMDVATFAEHFKAVRAKKLSKRTSKSAMLAKLKNLSVEQLAALANMAPSTQGDAS